MQSLSKTGTTAIWGAQVIRALMWVTGFAWLPGSTQETRENSNTTPQQWEGSFWWSFGKMGGCDSNQESPGLVPACWVDGGARWSRNPHAVTGRALAAPRWCCWDPSGRTSIYFGTIFSQQAAEANESQESDRLPACCAAHLGVLDHKSAERWSETDRWAKSHFCSVGNSQVREPSVSQGR